MANICALPKLGTPSVVLAVPIETASSAATPLRKVAVTVVVVASALVTMATSFSTASYAIAKVYRTFRSKKKSHNQAEIQYPNAESMDSIHPRHGVLPPRRASTSTPSAIAKRKNTLKTVLLAVCSTISAATSLIAASTVVRDSWSKLATRKQPAELVPAPFPTCPRMTYQQQVAQANDIYQGIKDAIQATLPFT